MGGSKKQKVGNRYFFGFAIVPCRRHDALLEIQFNYKTGWAGQAKSKRLSLKRSGLFGGDEREGGVSGVFDVRDGNTEQTISAYLSGAKDTLTSAMRGVVSIIAEQPYISANTARLPNIRTKHANIKSISRGWNEIDEIVDTTVPRSGDMYYFGYDLGRTVAISPSSNMKNGIADFIRGLKGTTNSVRVVAEYKNLSGTVNVEMTRYDCTDQDYDDLADFVVASNNGGTIVGGDNPINLSTAEDFFNRGVSGDGGVLTFGQTLLGQSFNSSESQSGGSSGQKHVFLLNASASTDQVSTANSVIENDLDSDVLVTMIKFQIGGGSYVDNGTYDMDATAISGLSFPLSAEETTTAIKKSIGDWFDMNPAHIIRCLWTDPTRGGTVSEADIGDSFEVEADRYLSEGMGFSPKFRGIDAADTDRKEVERHIDAISYRSNTTGKIELVSIRDDYDVNDLVTLDSDLVSDWSGLSRPRASEIPNQLTVKYTRRDGKDGSVTRSNSAGVRRRGRVVKATDAIYQACTTEALAIRLCLRDLRSVTTDILGGTIELLYLPPGLECGSVVIINEPDLGFDNIVMRVTETRIGASDNATAWVTLSEDKYATTQQIVIDEASFDNFRTPLQVQNRLVTEASYYQGVLNLGQSTLDDELELEPDIGRLVATGSKANGFQLEATLATKTGDDWIDQGLVDFEPYGVLVNDLSADPNDDEFLVEENETLDEVNAGDLARLGDEIIRIDNLVDQEDGTIMVTCGRGCLDGPPSRHSAASAFVLSSIVEPLDTDFISGQSVDVKMLSQTGDAALALGEAETESLTFASRAIRPYPVGNLKLDGSFTSTGVVTGDQTLTWSHRDRTFQTTPSVDDFTAGDIGPETGVTYHTVKQFFYYEDEPFYNDDGEPFYNDDGQPFYAVEASPRYEVEAAVSPVQGTTATVNVSNEPFYNGDGEPFYNGDGQPFYASSFDKLSHIAIGVRTKRDGYSDWITPTIDVEPLIAVSNFTGVSI